MKRGVLILVILALSLMLLACSKGNTITGRAVQGAADELKPVEKSAPSTTPEETASDEPSDDETADEPVEAPAYSDLKGTCQEDSAGVVRVFDEDGKKTVYRNTCFGNHLIDFGCDENNNLINEKTKCPGSCEIVRYSGQCN